MKNKTTNSRKVLLINPRFQLTFLGFTAALAGLVIATIYGANFYFFTKFYRLGVELKLPTDHVFFQFLHQQKNTMMTVFGVTSAVVFVTLTVLGLVFSHRIAGPLYRMQRHLQETAGRPKPVQFRKRDFFPELADAYNAQFGGKKASRKKAA